MSVLSKYTTRTFLSYIIIPEYPKVIGDASGGYFSLAFATLPPPHIERFSTLAVIEENYTSRQFAGYLHWEVSFSAAEISLIL